MDLERSCALVTGAASGLGEGAARRLAAAGIHVVAFDRNGDAVRQLAEEIEGTPVIGDVVDPDDCQRAVDRTRGEYPLRIVVNCAGKAWGERVVGAGGRVHQLDSFDAVLRLNVIGTFNVLCKAAAEMASREPTADGERGVIVNTASVAAFDGQIGQIAYSASKGAVVAMTLPSARDLAPVGIRVVAIAPGTFDTPLLSGLPEAVRTGLSREVLFPRRLGYPVEFGALVLHIASNSYLNGEVIRLDGGIRMPQK